MKAMVYNKYGTTNVLNLKEIEIPTLKQNEVLVKIHAVSVNSWDWDLLRGKPFLSRLGGLLKPKYKILGADIAGRVEAIGREVNHISIGDEVFGDISWCGWGGFAEYVSINAEALTLKPASMTFEEAAAIPQAGVLALQGLRDKGQIHEAKKVLINGAGGGVGTFALQIAKLYGAEVTCVDSGKKLDTLIDIGADHVIDYTEEDFTQRGKFYDLILDVVGTRSIFDYKRVLNPKGTYVMIGGSMSLILQLLLLGPMIYKTESKKMAILVHKPNKNDQNFLKELFVAGKLVPVIDRRYSLSQVEEAIHYLGEGHAKGKVVVCLENNQT
ncbi:NAD(P)-dependent alcohol dehydrogenase [Neobacillus sp. MM2021_6]|uniref:NAD(P)-dependent alcohol dehydrogenase n=1 Tax=Bacillaceae TaxID=186817 RepID=UPI00140BB204|nr:MULTISPECIES: NAD(P)-dependent alcohol dehydrogenase [Bacillaceae]MBO0960019.1 NAD(P)-dependent alcohol dehydrogenase [Neobacillus sp. MM2021_6]NHC18659.1 NAD(P)-dependent alcohol dehydrogenase [Bacillus sp. MM2020_4]